MPAVAPGIHRIGHGLINVYLVEEAGSVTIVDAGLPRYWAALPAELASMGRTLADVRAVLLTHAHSDHVGFAERIRRERSIPVLVHPDDAALARGEVKPIRDRRGPGFRGANPLAIARLLFHGIWHGTGVTALTEVGDLDDGTTLDVPGSPTVVHVPGHTAGSAALHLRGRGAIFIGDAFVTRNVVTGKRGPHFATMFNADHAAAISSLELLERLDARLVLPGHGDPFAEGIGEAVRLVRESIPAGLRA